MEVVDVKFGGLGVDSGQESEETVLAVVFEVVVGEVDSLAEFPVCLAVQLISSYEHCPILLTGGQYHHIGRYSLIRLDLNKLPHLNVLTQNGSPSGFFY